MRKLSLMVVSLVIFTVTCFAQTAQITGLITDSSKAVMAGVKANATNANTGIVRKTESNSEGYYAVPLLPPGSYTMLVQADGFKPISREEMTLVVGQVARIDFVMEVGSVSEQVTVQAAAPLLQSETSAVESVVENQTIVNMPLVNRRAAQLVKLSGFVVQTRNGFAIAGGRGDNSMWLIDGTNAQNVTLGVPQLEFDPPVESLQEFNVAISNYAAELGRSGGAVIQMITKSGTNQLHASAYEYLRNDALDARSFFSAAKPRLRYNLFGASIGGPVQKNKTFFFFNFEGSRSANESTAILNIPTVAETQGDFSRSSVVVRDPEAANRSPFPNNIIPSVRLDPIGARIASFYPEPNVAGRASGSSNFRTNRRAVYNPNNYVTRVDHTIRGSDRLQGRLLSWIYNSATLPVYPTPGVDTGNLRGEGSYHNVSGTWLHTFTPAFINELRVGYDRRKMISVAGGTGLGLNQKLGLTGVDPDSFPRITITGYEAFGSTTQERRQVPIIGGQLLDHATLTRAHHQLKFGFEWRYARNDDLNRTLAGGQFDFNNVATGNALASLLLGWVQHAQRVEAMPLQSRADAVALFLQDDWKVTRTLSLNLGLRWDLDQPRWEESNRQNSFDRAAMNPVSGTPGIVTFSGRNGLSKYAHNYDWNNLGPRFGFAWRLRDKWVIRGGSAIVYNPQYDAATPLVASLGFGFQGDFVSPDNGLTPAILLRNGLPPIAPPNDANLSAAFGAVRVGQSPKTAVEFLEPHGRQNGYLEQFNFNIQRQLGTNFLIAAGYWGTLGHHLSGAFAPTINQVPPELMGPGNAQLRRPFPQFSDVRVIAADIGNSNYHGLNLHVEQRYRRGLTFQANYTWSRSIDDLASRNERGYGARSAFANYYDRGADRGLSGNHISQRLVWSSVYELPFGKGKALRVGSGLLDQILGGWSTGFIANLLTGPPLGAVDAVDGTNSFAAAQRPNVVGNPQLPANRTKAEKLERWFNTAAFAQPAPFTFGNAGRTFGYGPGAIIMDLSVIKEFRLVENHRLQFRTEMMNFVNHANFDVPQLALGQANFGRISAVAFDPRIIQFGLHYSF